MVKKKNLAIILARKGSKRIPKKNIVEFHKKPLIAWTIKAAKESNLFDNIIVSTDSDEIKRISIDLGAEVPFLRKKHFDDFSPSSLATLDTLNLCEKELGFDYKNVFQLMPNCPLRTSKDIISSYNFFSKKEAVSQISCADFGWQNPWWAIKLNEENSGTPVFPKMFSQRSQDQEKLYGLSGAIWIAKTKALKKYKTFYCPGHIFYPISWSSAFDIDTLDDLKVAKKIFLNKKK